VQQVRVVLRAVRSFKLAKALGGTADFSVVPLTPQAIRRSAIVTQNGGLDRAALRQAAARRCDCCSGIAEKIKSAHHRRWCSDPPEGPGLDRCDWWLRKRVKRRLVHGVGRRDDPGFVLLDARPSSRAGKNVGAWPSSNSRVHRQDGKTCWRTYEKPYDPQEPW